MPSPYIRIIERDESTFAVTTSGTVVALVGFATKGPINTPTLCTSIDQFKKTFGLTPKEQPFSHLAAYKFFDQGGSLWFTRIADETQADYAEARVLTNNGTGVSAILTSANSITNAALASSTDYGIKITVEANGVEYSDDIFINLGISTDMNELINDLNTSIANSNVAGKVTAARTLANGTVSGTVSNNIYLTLKTVATGSDDCLTIADPLTGNSLISNGSVGFSFNSLSAWGTFSAPGKASVIGDIDITGTKNLNTSNQLNILIDSDTAVNTVDLSAENQAELSTDLAYNVITTSNGFNTERYNIKIVVDNGTPITVDLTGNAGIDSISGYQEISNIGSVGSFVAGTNSGLASLTYELKVNVDGNGITNISIPIGASQTWGQVVSAINGALTGATASLVNGKIRITSNSKGSSSSIAITDGDLINNPLLAAIDALGATYTPATETAVSGLDVVLTKAQIVSRINTAINGFGLARYVGNYLFIKTNTKGSSGSIEINQTGIASTSAFGLFTATPLTTITKLGGAATTKEEIVAAINSQLNTLRGTIGVVYASVYYDPISEKNLLKLQSEVSGATDAKIYINSLNGTVANAPVGTDAAPIVFSATWSASTFVDTGDNGSVNSMFKFVFKEKGTAAAVSGTKGCKIQFVTRTNPLYLGAGDIVNQKYYRDLIVYFDSQQVEKFEDISYNRASSNWFVTKVNADPTNGGSSYISVEWYQADADGTLNEDLIWTTEPTTGTFLIPDGYLSLEGGNDGIPVGSIDSYYQTGIQTFANPELYDPHIIATPGVSSISVINATKNFIEGANRQDILYLVDPPFGLSPSEVADWHNGKSSSVGAPSAAINSSYLALYWGWLKTYDADNGEYVWAPPSVFMMAKLTELDNTYKQWNIPAGISRGKITADDYEYSPSQAERDLLYDINGNLNVNPIVNFPGTGLIIWGQKTLLRENSALNRINVRRMIIYVKKLMKINLKAFMFEPNTPATWARVTTTMNNILEPIRQDGGITQYEVIFDETTTTPSMQDQGILKGVVRVTPVKSIEAIEVTFAVTGQGVTLG